MSYTHIQTGKLHLILLAPALILLIVPWFLRHNEVAMIASAATPFTLVLIAFCFQKLLVRDEGDCLVLRYGPIPLIRKRFTYTQITAAEPARSTFIDGWGIHYTGKGWIYNLWGFGCVKIQMGNKTVRIGTDDVDALAAFLNTKILGSKTSRN